MIQSLRLLGKSRQLAKGQTLFLQGEQQGNLFFIERGLVKAYYQMLDGKTFIKSFLREGESIASLQALVDEAPCSFSVVALEDCTVWEVPRRPLLDAILSSPDQLADINQFLLRLAMKKEQREYEFLCLSPEQRYRTFCTRESALLPRLSQQDIALYLGITPVALSRIRKRCASLG